ncbi:MAG: hypothetical protein CSA97_04775 [Bacteroidetes bacterium]|nr:MAG: hypothetical protein CSA97_04775 [Bacteroidota bacterium]
MKSNILVPSLILLAIALSALLPSCIPKNSREFVDEAKSRHFGYSPDRSQIFYEYTHDPSRSNDPLTVFIRGRNDYHWVLIPEANPQTFRVLDNNFARDDRHLYFRNRIADFVDYPTFRHLPHLHRTYIDAKHVYQLKTSREDFIDENGATASADLQYLDIIEEADAKTYRPLYPLAGETGTDWAKDAHHIFRHNELVDSVDYQTFRTLTTFIHADKDFIYSEFLKTKIPNSHGSSEGFRIIRKQNADIVYTDRYLYYALADSLYEYPVQDIATLGDFDSAFYFTLDGRVYYYNEQIPGAHAPTFEPLHKFGHMARDREHLFYKNQLVAEGIDPQEVSFNEEEYDYFYRGLVFNDETLQFEAVKK